MPTALDKLFHQIKLLLHEYEYMEDVTVGCIISLRDKEYTFDGEEFVETT